MPWEPIRKKVAACRVSPHLLDYGKTCADFSWDGIRRELDGLPGGKGLNIAHEAADRHLGGPQQDRLAMRWLGKDGGSRDVTYLDLARATSRFANVLKAAALRKFGLIAAKNISNPSQIASMAAYSLVLLSNALFIPVSSKLVSLGMRYANRRLAGNSR